MESMKEEIMRIQQKYGDVNLIDMVHQYLIEKDQKKYQQRIEEGRIGKFYPSSVGQCKRKIAYQMLGYPSKPKDGQTLLILENGTSFHDRMEKIFEEMGILIAPELKLKNDELRISGRSDAIIWNYMKQPGKVFSDDQIIQLYRPVYDENGRPVFDEDGNEKEELVYEGLASDVLIVEFKSISSKQYNRYLPKDRPKREHEMQLQLYFYLTGIRAGLVYYENKDTQEHKYYYVEYDQQLVNEIVHDIRYIINCIDKGVLPPRDFEPTSFQCRYCDFRDICHPIQSPFNLDDIL